MQSSSPKSKSLGIDEQISASELEDIVAEHPYYSMAQFRLLFEYTKTQSELFDQQSAVTALFFNNQNWLNYQLHHQQKDEKEDTDEGQPHLAGIENTEDKQGHTIITQNNTDRPIAFEPMHLVDYFASQGIKLGEEALAQDKLGTQLKSFTEWLKSMKKIHPEKLPEGDEQTDKKIRSLAETSNTQTNVITEAMAEVLLKQGKVEQAIEMYEKLSLNYPPEMRTLQLKLKV